MSEMVERVAQALYDAEVARRNESIAPWEDATNTVTGSYFRKMARVSIRALREPTAAMLASSSDAWGDAFSKTEYVWKAMIDEALK